MKNVVIVAGGLNTRFEELSVFPKVLLPMLSGKSILKHDCDLYDGYHKYLVINEKYYDMVTQYVTNNKLDIKVICAHNTNGSMNTLMSIYDELPKTEVLFIWSDLVLKDKIVIDEKDLDTNANICIKNGPYRIKVGQNLWNGRPEFKGHVDPKDNEGNVPGIYYFKRFSVKSYKEDMLNNYDLAEYIIDKDIFGMIDIEDKEIMEFRDKFVYLKYYLHSDAPLVSIPRFFNKIEKTPDGLLIKQCINKEFNHLIDTEIDWYQYMMDNMDHHLIPRIYNLSKGSHLIVMENVKGKNMSRYIQDLDPVEIHRFLIDYVGTINDLHGIKGGCHPEEKEADFNKEFRDKVIDRCDKISHMILGYDREALLDILNKALSYLKENTSYKYCLLHGDLNGSNVLVTDDKKIKFIDPRGYFGNTKMYGPSEYDFAKVLYMLYGYDDFNQGRYVYWNENYYNKPKMLCSIDNIHPDINNKVTRIMVGIIFIALAQYISQDIFKVNIAYRYGLEILRNEL